MSNNCFKLIERLFFNKNSFQSQKKYLSSTYYVLDATGNVMATYDKEIDYINSEVYLKLKDRSIYGSSRVGVRSSDIDMFALHNPNYSMKSVKYEIGKRTYELSNHLGNVLSVISDKPIPSFEHEELAGMLADVRVAQDYSPFGVTLSGRSFEVDGGYRWGFNSMEKDDEVKGRGNSYDFGARMYDSRLGRWLTIDALAGKYPNLSPYNFVANSPIIFIDFDGNDFEPTIDPKSKNIVMKATIYTTTKDEDVLKSSVKHWMEVSGKYDVKFGKGKDAVRYNVKFEFEIISLETQRIANTSFLKDETGKANSFIVSDEDVSQRQKVGTYDFGVTVDSHKIYIRENSQEKRKTGSHEIGHIFGLFHRNKNLMRSGENRLDNETRITKSTILDILKISGLKMKTPMIRSEYNNEGLDNKSAASDKITSGTLGEGKIKKAKYDKKN